MEETFSHLSFAKKMDYISQETFTELQRDIAELKRMVNGFINYLKQSKELISEPLASYTYDLQTDEEPGFS